MRIFLSLFCVPLRRARLRHAEVLGVRVRGRRRGRDRPRPGCAADAGCRRGGRRGGRRARCRDADPIGHRPRPEQQQQHQQQGDDDTDDEQHGGHRRAHASPVRPRRVRNRDRCRQSLGLTQTERPRIGSRWDGSTRYGFRPPGTGPMWPGRTTSSARARSRLGSVARPVGDDADDEPKGPAELVSDGPGRVLRREQPRRIRQGEKAARRGAHGPRLDRSPVHRATGDPEQSLLPAGDEEVRRDEDRVVPDEAGRHEERPADLLHHAVRRLHVTPPTRAASSAAGPRARRPGCAAHAGP